MGLRYGVKIWLRYSLDIVKICRYCTCQIFLLPAAPQLDPCGHFLLRIFLHSTCVRMSKERLEQRAARHISHAEKGHHHSSNKPPFASSIFLHRRCMSSTALRTTDFGKPIAVLRSLLIKSLFDSTLLHGNLRSCL